MNLSINQLFPNPISLKILTYSAYFFAISGPEEGGAAGLCKQARCEGMYERSRNFTVLEVDVIERSSVAHTGMLCSHWRRVSLLEEKTLR